MSTLTPLQISKIIEFAEADAMLNLIPLVPPKFARPFKVAAKKIGSVRVFMIPKLDSPFFNRISCLGMGEPATESMLDEAIGFLQGAGCTNYMAQVSPLAQPEKLPEWLVARGLKPSRNWIKVYRGDDPAPAIHTDLRLEKIDKDQADAFGGLLIATFEVPSVLRPFMQGSVGQPNWHSYLGFSGNKPVSCASMYVNGEVAWLGNMGTLKEYRRHGAQGAMFARRIQDGLALGCKWFVTETGDDTPEDPNPSYHNMLRSGFTLAYKRINYVHQVPASPLKLTSRALFVAAYTLKFGLQRLHS